MSCAPHTTVPLQLDNMMDTYLSPVDPDGFNAVYSADMIERIYGTFSMAISLSSSKNNDLAKERIISKAWYSIHNNETLCPGYLLNISKTKADETDTNKYRIDGALILEADQDLIDEDHPNYMLGHLGIKFKHDNMENDAQNDCANTAIEVGAYTQSGVHGQHMSYGERVFFFQHCIGLFMLLVNGGDFRVIHWDRSGCIITKVLSYVDIPNHMKKLLRFFYTFLNATPAQCSVDPTATHLSKESCGWQWMQKVATTHPRDIDHAEGTVVPSVPLGFIIKPTCDAPPSSLIATNILASNPAATNSFSDFSSPSAASDAIIPVFKYVCDFFRESITGTWLPYCLKVCGRDYLVTEPIFAPHDLVGRSTRRYVALEWEMQRLVFLKDVWHPFYEGVAQEGATFADLNDTEVPFVLTLICHEDIGGPGAQETEALQYASTGEKKHDVLGHKFAVVECGILHHDVSTGNILICPVVACRKTGEGMVIWIGILGDWELAKALPGDLEVAKARQPHRTGTWYSMSVYFSNYPGHPPSITDELESFLHVTIYLAIRFLCTRSLNVWDFVNNYFEDFCLSDRRMTCGHLKQNIIQTGSLKLGYTPVHFATAPPVPADQDAQGEVRLEISSPLNEIIKQYLAFFKARYAVLEYTIRAAMEEQHQENPPSGMVQYGCDMV
ncbi:hypothetical protein V8D89_010981 [Ganoderma adspersum]